MSSRILRRLFLFCGSLICLPVIVWAIQTEQLQQAERTQLAAIAMLVSLGCLYLSLLRPLVCQNCGHIVRVISGKGARCNRCKSGYPLYEPFE